MPAPTTSDAFRPSTILLFISKDFQSIIQEQINKFSTNNNILHTCQSDFRKNLSCTTALAHVTEDIRSNVHENKITFLTLLDRSK